MVLSFSFLLHNSIFASPFILFKRKEKDLLSFVVHNCNFVSALHWQYDYRLFLWYWGSMMLPMTTSHHPSMQFVFPTCVARSCKIDSPAPPPFPKNIAQQPPRKFFRTKNKRYPQPPPPPPIQNQPPPTSSTRLRPSRSEKPTRDDTGSTHSLNPFPSPTPTPRLLKTKPNRTTTPSSSRCCEVKKASTRGRAACRL